MKGLLFLLKSINLFSPGVRLFVLSRQDYIMVLIDIVMIGPTDPFTTSTTLKPFP